MAEEQAVPQKSRKRHRLEGIEVHTVGFVDSPAVGGSEFIIAKAYTEDGMALLQGEVAKVKAKKPKPDPEEEMEDPEEEADETDEEETAEAADEPPPKKKGKKLKTHKAAADEGDDKGGDDAPLDLHPRHARAILSAVHNLEDAAVPYPGEPTPKMPPEILDHVRGLRHALRGHLKKAEAEEEQEAMNSLNKVAVCKQAVAEADASVQELKKIGTRYSKDTKTKLSGVRDRMHSAMKHLKDGHGSLSEMLGEQMAPNPVPGKSKTEKSLSEEIVALMKDMARVMGELEECVALSPEEKREYKAVQKAQEAEDAYVEYLAGLEDEPALFEELKQYDGEKREYWVGQVEKRLQPVAA